MYDILGDRERSRLYLEETLSTNDDLKKIIYASDDPVFSLVYAGHQTSGRGRLGKSFFSPEGGLYFSLSFPLCGKEKNIPFLTLLAGLAVSEAIEKLTGVRTHIKWPNDIYLNGRKLGGILCELVSGRTLTAVVGIGINMGVSKEEIPSELTEIMTSFCAEGIPLPERKALAEAVCSKLDSLVYAGNELFNVSEKTLDAIRSRSFSIGKKVKYVMGENTVEGIISDIAPTGGAVLELSDGSKKEIFYGEITQ